MTTGKYRGISSKYAVVGLTIASAIVSGCGGHEPEPLNTHSSVTTVASNTLPTLKNHSALLKLPANSPIPKKIQRSSSTIALVEAGARALAYVADEDARAILTVDVETGLQLARTSLGARPSSLLVMPDGRVVATLVDQNRLAVLYPGAEPTLPLRVSHVTDVPTEPTSIAATPQFDRVLVVSRWGGSVSEVRVPAEERRSWVSRTLDVEADPFSVVVMPDGRTAVVSHVVGGKVSKIDLRAWTTSVEDRSRTVRQRARVHRRISRSRSKHLVSPFSGEFVQNSRPQRTRRMHKQPRPHGFRGVPHVQQAAIRRIPIHGFALASVGSEIVLPVSEIFPGEQNRITTGYGSSVPFEAPVQERVLRFEPAGSLASRGAGSRLPRCRIPRAAVGGDGDTVLVACQGDSVVVGTGGWGRVDVPAGPTGMAWDVGRGRLVVWSQQARQLSVITKRGPAGATIPTHVASHAMPYIARDSLLTHGRELFFATDKRISSDGRSCASCHPGGRQDGLVWSTPHGPRQTPMLAGRLSGTAPYGWNGDAKSIEEHLGATFKRLGGKGLTDSDRAALATYVKSLSVPQSRPKTPPELIATGKAIFHSEQAECGSCHQEKRSFSDTLLYPIVRAPADRKGEFNTPALVGLAKTAPYFHDGRYPTLLAMLDGTDGKMGHSSHLDAHEKTALVAYLESL